MSTPEPTTTNNVHVVYFFILPQIYPNPLPCFVGFLMDSGQYMNEFLTWHRAWHPKFVQAQRMYYIVGPNSDGFWQIQDSLGRNVKGDRVKLRIHYFSVLPLSLKQWFYQKWNTHICRHSNQNFFNKTVILEWNSAMKWLWQYTGTINAVSQGYQLYK